MLQTYIETKRFADNLLMIVKRRKDEDFSCRQDSFYCLTARCCETTNKMWGDHVDMYAFAKSFNINSGGDDIMIQ